LNTSRVNSQMEVIIRKFSPGDREEVRRICWNTGYGGSSVAPFFDDPMLFADFWCTYFTDIDPLSTFVADADSRVVGYLLGCLDTEHYNRIFSHRVVPAILGKALRGRYRIQRKTLRYISSLLGQQLRREYKIPSLDHYPAHLHINIAEGYRRTGLGRRLMESYFAHLRENQITGLHLGTSSLHTSALPFYDKLGFKVYTAIESTFLGQPVTNICYVKKL
jgi:ribosomal protein S18 acetylase RimI-like enzyme